MLSAFSVPRLFFASILPSAMGRNERPRRSRPDDAGDESLGGAAAATATAAGATGATGAATGAAGAATGAAGAAAAPAGGAAAAGGGAAGVTGAAAIGPCA